MGNIINLPKGYQIDLSRIEHLLTSFKRGDKVKLRHHPQNPTGKITNVEYDFYQPEIQTYTVKFDDEDMIPPEMSGYTDDQLILLTNDGKKHKCFCPLIDIMLQGCKCGGI